MEQTERTVLSATQPVEDIQLPHVGDRWLSLDGKIKRVIGVLSDSAWDQAAVLCSVHTLGLPTQIPWEPASSFLDTHRYLYPREPRPYTFRDSSGTWYNELDPWYAYEFVGGGCTRC